MFCNLYYTHFYNTFTNLLNFFRIWFLSSRTMRNFLLFSYLVCGIPYLIPTPTLGSAFITFFTVACSGKAKRIDAETKTYLKVECHWENFKHFTATRTISK